jgi:hypothetical protein
MSDLSIWHWLIALCVFGVIPFYLVCKLLIAIIKWFDRH